MANSNIDDILARLDEIKKLQAELRHLMPRVTGNSTKSGPQDLTSDASASIRFPSLFTFPGVANSASSTARNGRVQKSSAYLNLNNKLSLSDNRRTATASPSTWNSTKARSSMKEMNALRSSLKNAHDVVGKSQMKSSLVPNVSASTANPTRTTQSLMKSNSNRTSKHLQGAIARGSMCSSVQTLDAPICVERPTESRGITQCFLKRNIREGNGMPGFIERILGKLNYCFVDDKRVTVPHHYPGNGTPRRVHVHRAATSEGETLQVHVSEAKIFAN